MVITSASCSATGYPLNCLPTIWRVYVSPSASAKWRKIPPCKPFALFLWKAKTPARGSFSLRQLIYWYIASITLLESSLTSTEPEFKYLCAPLANQYFRRQARCQAIRYLPRLLQESRIFLISLTIAWKSGWAGISEPKKVDSFNVVSPWRIDYADYIEVFVLINLLGFTMIYI